MSEQSAQVALARWLDQRPSPYVRGERLLWTHPPNGFERSARAAGAAKRAGAKAGVPDVLIFEPPPRRPGARGAAWELKVGKGRRSAPQERWARLLDLAGWVVGCGTADEARTWLMELGY